MVYGDFNKFCNVINLANEVLNNNPFDNVALNKNYNVKNNNEKKDDEENKFDYLLDEIHNTFNLNNEPSPRPCVSQEEFVKNAREQVNDKVKKHLEKYIYETDKKHEKSTNDIEENVETEFSYEEFEEKCKRFKKYLKELIGDDKELLNAIYKLFDFIMFQK